MTHISPPIKPFHRLVKTSCTKSWKPHLSSRWDQRTLPEAAAHLAQGLPRLRRPAPVARPQRGAGNACQQPGLPTQALSAFLFVYSSNSATSPTKSVQRLQRAERVCCPQGTDGAFPFVGKAALGLLGNGVQGVGCTDMEHGPGTAKDLHSPMLRVFLPKFPADPAIWLDWQNKSGKTARLELGAVVQLHVTFTYACQMTFLKLLK